VTLPGVAPTTFFLTIMALINSFKVFDQISVITQGGPGTSTVVMAYYIYQEAFQYYQMGYASAMSWIMFVIIMAITLIQWKFGDKSN
jgi:multiple sugar transport system permease protein